jgi:pumilio RNA-binding family
MDANNYLNLHNTANAHQPPPRSRQPSGLLGSIWAPQPQPSDTTWPRALDSFSREAEQLARPDASHNSTGSTHMQPAIVSREDVFGSPQPQVQPAREVGAIGDGRKKSSPDLGDTVSFILVPIGLVSDILACPAC